MALQWNDLSSSGSSEEDHLFMEMGRITVDYLIARSQRRRNPVLTRQPALDRDREGANDTLYRHYFSPDPVYTEDHFRRRFRMSRQLFMRISNDLSERYPFFQQRVDARGQLGFTSLQKCTAAIRQLAYGIASDAMDEYIAMSEKIARNSLHYFCQGIISIYSRQYLRKPTMYDIQRIYEVHGEKHGFPGMLGSLDCTHVGWVMCPTAWRGQFHRGDHSGPSVILEAVALHDLWFWHAFFGVAGSNNDLNVIDQSPIFDNLIDGVEPPQSFYANNVNFKYSYYLVDGIYNEWATLVQAFSSQLEDKRKYFTKKQESARKDIERAFGVLKKRFALIANPIRFWTRERIMDVVYTCILLHNMILEDRGLAICQNYQGDVPRAESTIDNNQRLDNIRNIKNREIHGNLRRELVEHLWARCPDDVVLD